MNYGLLLYHRICLLRCDMPLQLWYNFTRAVIRGAPISVSVYRYIGILVKNMDHRYNIGISTYR